MYKCNNCGYIFEETYRVMTTYEDYYGVSDLFPDSHMMILHLCPNCKDEDIEEYEKEEEKENE